MYVQIAFPGKTIKTNEQAIKLGTKGGKVSSDKKKLAAHVRAAKKWGIKPKVATKVYEMLQSPELSSTDWYKHIDVLEEMAKHEPRLIPQIINFKKDWHKAAHGEKLHTENVHHIINWNQLLGDNDKSKEANEFKGQD